jgi:hypothetical protein
VAELQTHVTGSQMDALHADSENGKKLDKEDDGPPLAPQGKFWLHDKRDGTTVIEDLPRVDRGPEKWKHDFYEREMADNAGKS